MIRKVVSIISQKNISFKVDEDFHTKVKIQAAKEKKSLQSLIVEVLKERIENTENEQKK